MEEYTKEQREGTFAVILALLVLFSSMVNTILPLILSTTILVAFSVCKFIKK
jgi:hypothetical protein